MTGYCDNCGNQQCICDEFIDIDAINAMTREELAASLRTVDSIVAENVALRADLEGVRLINKLQAEALAEERDLTRRYKSEIAALRAVLREYVEKYHGVDYWDEDIDREDRALALLGIDKP
jgi:hypothetical protein